VAIWSILLQFRIFCGHLAKFASVWVYFTSICGHFGIFFQLWYVVPRKIWQPWPETTAKAVKESPLRQKSLFPARQLSSGVSFEFCRQAGVKNGSCHGLKTGL
jgi:hypothetical protein